ncbi:peptide deformylase, partial [Hymenobacter gummosus]
MIYPIVAYGDSVLKARAKDIPADFPADELQKLIADMYETLYYANGVGLAAPQIGKSVRLFVIDSAPMVDDDED